ncbi:HD family phosphohydrolase [Coprobacter tertius]|uniref:HDIG domain-containing protein n=1 Tax=Coprobacter tertius TaxID=2944915 RepID=A0ABT1MG31_9BACT|nr:HDIG domain-containing metalloprotein [Coprobacter tertius]MCP9611599.1 HDIG domain-containing protein [Coprobacter tertius]
MEVKKKYKFISRKALFQTLFFIGAVLLTIYFYPREEKFRYHFQEGKPWKYGLLTASFDFPIYKSRDQVKREQDSILKTLQPYITYNPEIGKKQVERFQSAYHTSLKNKLSVSLYNNIFNAIQEVYKQGIIAPSVYDSLQKIPGLQVRIIENNIAKTYPAQNLLTPRAAYEEILAKLPDDGSRSSLYDYNLHTYLSENMTFDRETTNKIKNELLQRISLSSGVVQAGERIVDRGEIISPHTYRILKSLESVTLKKTVNLEHRETTLLGEAIVITCLFSFFYLFLALFRPHIFNDLRSLGFLLLMIVSVTLTAYFLTQMKLLGIYLVPFAILPIIVVTFLDSRIALYAHLITVLLCAFAAPFSLEFIFLQIIVGMTAIDSLSELVKRSQLVRCAFLVFMAYSISYVGYTLLSEGDWTKINWNMFLYFGGSSALLLFAYLLIYLLEKTFGFISNVTLVELSDINSPILRQLSEICPGTFQHSMQVANLASEAANKIGAKAQLVRTGALYHDIGKLGNPAFFTENQSGVNPHQTISYEQSAKIIIQHITDGLKMADKLMLPQAIKDFIATHHGKSKTKYFYNSYKNEFPDYPINEASFTYPGPNPFTKETAILMMADSVEAASRSLKEYTEESISKLVNHIIDSQIADGLMKNAPISFRDVEIIKNVFIEKLKTMYHTRISYPELKQEEKNPGFTDKANTKE